MAIAEESLRARFGKKVMDFQNTQFELAECKTEATIGKVFLNHCIEQHLAGNLDSATASMAKYWLSDLQCTIIDRCLLKNKTDRCRYHEKNDGVRERVRSLRKRQNVPARMRYDAKEQRKIFERPLRDELE